MEEAAAQACGKSIEIWFQDEARVGQKNKITRRWAKRGTRPSAPRDQRTASAYIFGAICPAEGKGAGLVLPSCNSEAMALHLEEISLAVVPGAHALVLLDQAGWHVSKKLPVPGNITLVPLPPKSPELNPVENIWQFMRDNWLSNRVFKSYDDILDHCCFTWNKLIDMPWKIMSIGTREWAYRAALTTAWIFDDGCTWVVMASAIDGVKINASNAQTFFMISFFFFLRKRTPEPLSASSNPYSHSANFSCVGSTTSGANGAL